MFFKKTSLRISESVLAAQRALVQMLEVLNEKEVRLCDLKVSLGDIFPSETLEEISCETRKMILEGHAQTFDEKGPSAPFQFHLSHLSLIKLVGGNWQVKEDDRATLIVDEMVVNGEKTYIAYWEIGQKQHTLNVCIANYLPESGDVRKYQWLVGTSRFDRRERPIYLPQS
jgi:hypothetical protein